MNQYSAQSVTDALEAIAPKSLGNPTDQLGYLHGDPSITATGVACMWNAHTNSIKKAVELDANVLIVHELLWYAPQETPWCDGPKTADAIIANQKRQAIFEKYDMAVYRCHSNWDALPVDGVPDKAVQALGIEGVKVIGEQKYFKVHELPEAMTLKQLSEIAKAALNMPWVCVFGEAEQVVKRFAFLIGGFGANQWHMPQAAYELGAEAIIIGEMTEWEVMAAMECGMGVIETLHSRSEIPALQRQAEMLADALPGLPVHYVDSGALGFHV